MNKKEYKDTDAWVLKAFRKVVRLTGNALGEAIGLSKKGESIRAIERGSQKLGMKYLVLLTKTFGVCPVNLREGYFVSILTSEEYTCSSWDEWKEASNHARARAVDHALLTAINEQETTDSKISALCALADT